jgi:hypothetical protein
VRITSRLPVWVLGALLMGGAMLAGEALAQEHGEHGREGPGREGPGRDGLGRSMDGRGQVLDSRYNHGRFYPPMGTSIRALPEGYRPYFHGGGRFYFAGGVWYAPGPAGFVVVRPPFGLVVSVLPPYYSTVWIGGIPYYYANNVYYTWQPDQNGYVVAEPPGDPNAPAQPPPPGSQEDLIIYPKNGQSSEQQAADRYECHRWAKSQTGFDPTVAGSGGDRNNYNRAMSACLQARGYEVK